MKKILLVIGLVSLVIGLGVLLGPAMIYYGLLFVGHDFSPHFLSIDGCLDSGGCWDYIENVCRKHEPDAQELCDRGNPHR